MTKVRKMHTNRADMERATRWMDRALTWKARGFGEAAKYCTGQAHILAAAVYRGVGQKGNGSLNPMKARAKAMMEWVDRVDAIPESREAFEASMNEFWNGHSMTTNEHQQERAVVL